MSQFYKLNLSRKVNETPNAVSLYFSIPDNLKEEFSFKAGQYLTLKTDINGESVRRAYSISSIDPSDEIRVSVKKVEGGRMSSYLVDQINAGDEIEVMVPQGNFLLKDSSNYLFVAGGSGITPILSLIQEAKSKAENMVLLFANSDANSVMFKTELDEITDASGLNIHYFNSSENKRIDEKTIQEAYTGLVNAKAYICGPQALMDMAKTALEKNGCESSDIHIEYFSSPELEGGEEKMETVASGEVNEVELIIDDETHKVTMESYETILEAGERIGIDPPFSCQSGVCTTCRAKVLSGEAEMENNFGLGQDEVDEGYILTCISKPKSPGLVISWDE